MEPKWTKVESRPEFWRPEANGDNIEGILERFIDSQYGKTAIVAMANGEKLCLPNTIVLNALMGEVSVGCSIKVVFTGEERGPNGSYKTFDVFYVRQLPGSKKNERTR